MVQVLVVIGLVAVTICLMLLVTYNGLMQLRHEVRLAWGELDRQLHQRYEVIPQLIATAQRLGDEPAAKSAAIAAAKNRVAIAITPAQLAAAEGALGVAIQQTLQACGDGPEIRLIGPKLLEIERRIERARRVYNDRVGVFNDSLAAFPTNCTAVLIRFSPQPVFDWNAKNQ